MPEHICARECCSLARDSSGSWLGPSGTLPNQCKNDKNHHPTYRLGPGTEIEAVWAISAVSWVMAFKMICHYGVPWGTGISSRFELMLRSTVLSSITACGGDRGETPNACGVFLSKTQNIRMVCLSIWLMRHLGDEHPWAAAILVWKPSWQGWTDTPCINMIWQLYWILSVHQRLLEKDNWFWSLPWDFRGTSPTSPSDQCRADHANLDWQE